MAAETKPYQGLNMRGYQIVSKDRFWETRRGFWPPFWSAIVPGPISRRKPHYFTCTCTFRRAVAAQHFSVLCLSQTHLTTKSQWKLRFNSTLRKSSKDRWRMQWTIKTPAGSYQLTCEPTRTAWKPAGNLKAVTTLAAVGRQGVVLQGRLWELQDIIETNTGGSKHLETKPDQSVPPLPILFSGTIPEFHGFLTPWRKRSLQMEQNLSNIFYPLLKHM